MELDLKILLEKYNLSPRGVINIGCHYFQERELFMSIGLKKYLLFEPQIHAFKEAHKRIAGLDCILINCALSDKEGKAEMYCDDVNVNLGASSSLLKPEKHIERFPWVKFDHKEQVIVHRLDDIKFDRKDYDMIFIDVQGNELNVFKGATDTLKNINCIFTEVNFELLYKDCVLVNELDSFLSLYNFKRVETGKDLGGFTDAMYIKI